MKPWTVARAWWEMTKLVLARRGGYDLYVHVDDLSDDAQNEFNDANWAVYHLDWVGGGDRYAVLSAEPEDGAPTPRPVSGARAELEQQVTELRAVNDHVSGMLLKEQMVTAGLASDVHQQVAQVTALRLRAEIAEAEADRLRADHTYVAAERCECGGDTELYWRTRAHELEQQARQDRANAVRLSDQVEYWRQRYSEAEHQVHIAEQLGRVR